MSIFNSLGSNYSASMVGHSLLPVSGKSGTRLREELKRQYGAEEALLTYKCREAITLILRQLQLPADSYVAINGYTCYVVYAAVIAAGLKPYLLDITEGDLNFSASGLKAALRKQPDIRAVIIQNTLGMPAPMKDIRDLCAGHDMPLIEDLAHSAGLVYENGEPAGTAGQASALSFSQDKMIDAVSGGAALLFSQISSEPDYKSVSTWQRLQAYWYPANTLIIRKTHHIGLGKIWLKLLRLLRLLPNQMAGNPSDIRNLPDRQAKLALEAMSELPETIAHRQKIASIYRTALPPDVQLPHKQGSTYIRFPLLVENPRGLEAFLKGHDIHIARPWYDAVIAPGRYMELTDYRPGQCPEAESVAAHIVNLPTHINITEEAARHVAEKVNLWLSR